MGISDAIFDFINGGGCSSTVNFLVCLLLLHKFNKVTEGNASMTICLSKVSGR